jgi:hypothetical protein
MSAFEIVATDSCELAAHKFDILEVSRFEFTDVNWFAVPFEMFMSWAFDVTRYDCVRLARARFDWATRSVPKKASVAESVTKLPVAILPPTNVKELTLSVEMLAMPAFSCGRNPTLVTSG